MLRESSRKGFVRQPDQAGIVRCQLRRLGMRFQAIEHVRDFLAFLGSKGGHVNQRLHAFGTCERYDGTGVGVPGQG